MDPSRAFFKSTGSELMDIALALNLYCVQFPVESSTPVDRVKKKPPGKRPEWIAHYW